MRNLSKKTFLITGGCGFIGSALVRSLIKAGNFIINIDKISYASNLESVEPVNEENYIFFQNDINERHILKDIFREYKPDYIIHLAAESHVDRSIDDANEFMQSNIIGTYSLLDESYKYWAKTKKVLNDDFKFLLVSTDEVYGSINKEKQIFYENSPIEPNSPYAASKASSDLLARAWNKTYNFPIITTNCSNNYGIWQFPEKLIPLVIKKCLTNEEIPIYGKGDQLRDWISVNDHVEALKMVLFDGNIGEKYNIGSSKEIRNIDMVKIICSLMDSFEPRENGIYSDLIIFVDDRPGHDFGYSLNTDKIRKKLNWSPSIKLEEGLKQTILWYLDNKEWLFGDTEKKYKGQRLGKLKI